MGNCNFQSATATLETEHLTGKTNNTQKPTYLEMHPPVNKATF